MLICNHCHSENTVKKGKAFHLGEIHHRYKCKNCGTNSYTNVAQVNIPKVVHVPKLKRGRTWVITSAVSDVIVNQPFLDTLINYCKVNQATLLVIPIKYKQHGLAEANAEYTWDDSVKPYLIKQNTRLLEKLVLMAGININPTIVSPLASLESFSKGDSLIFGATQVAMKSIALSHTEGAAIVTTTGACTNPVYSESKAGCRATFNHSYSAVVIEEDLEIDDFHYRVISYDKEGYIYDVDKKYCNDALIDSDSIAALVTGDTHTIFADPLVTAATYSNSDSVVNILKPEQIIMHDVLDSYAISHWHSNDLFTQFGKYKSGTNRIEEELHLTMKYLIDHVPEYSQAVVVASNHDSHLTRWMSQVKIANEPWNAETFHLLSWLMLKQTNMGNAGVEYPDAFALWCKYRYPDSKVKFLTGFDSYRISGIEVALHGDRGSNGSRGALAQFSKLGMKTITGHSHSPGIIGGAYAVGHSCYSRLSYNSGASSWIACHAIIHQNGKRQLLIIKKGKWRR
jgi:hypothetical protein